MAIRPATQGGPKDGSSITFPVRFELSQAEAAQQRITPADSPPLLDQVTWVQRPNGDDFARRYPDGATRKGVSGRANVLCIIRADGGLERCRALYEAPVGFGFGEATRGMAEQHFRLDPKVVGPDAVGKSVWVPVIWQLGG